MRAALAVAATGWLALLVFAPALPVAVAGVTYLFGALICHQLPDRSFHVDGAQLPVCARCLGIYAGTALLTVSRLVRGSESEPLTTRHRAPAFARSRRFATRQASTGLSVRQGGPTRRGSPQRAARRRLTPRLILIVGVVPTVVTVGFETAGVWSPSNLVRAFAGVALGAAVASVVSDALTTINYDQCAPQRPIAPPRPPTHI
jgi:uncharacterized membrane protein